MKFVTIKENNSMRMLKNQMIGMFKLPKIHSIFKLQEYDSAKNLFFKSIMKFIGMFKLPKIHNIFKYFKQVQKNMIVEKNLFF